MLVGEHECLHKSESFVHRASNRQVVDGDLAQVLVAVDDEEATEGDAVLLLEHSVRAGNGATLVGKKGDFHLSQSSLLTGSVHPEINYDNQGFTVIL